MKSMISDPIKIEKDTMKTNNHQRKSFQNSVGKITKSG